MIKVIQIETENLDIRSHIDKIDEWHKERNKQNYTKKYLDKMRDSCIGRISNIISCKHLPDNYTKFLWEFKEAKNLHLDLITHADNLPATKTYGFIFITYQVKEQ